MLNPISSIDHLDSNIILLILIVADRLGSRFTLVYIRGVITCRHTTWLEHVVVYWHGKFYFQLAAPFCCYSFVRAFRHASSIVYDYALRPFEAPLTVALVCLQIFSRFRFRSTTPVNWPIFFDDRELKPDPFDAQRTNEYRKPLHRITARIGCKLFQLQGSNINTYYERNFHRALRFFLLIISYYADI